MSSGDIVWLRHNRIDLALHPLAEGEGRALLLLHALGEHTPTEVPAVAAGWPGPVWGLDFTGHGESTVPAGGGYTCEALMADADQALAHLGEITLLGRGLGAYIALMLAGARAGQVHGAVLTDGHGLAGGGSRPGTAIVDMVSGDRRTAPDPYALLELSTDMRPRSYATAYVRLAVENGPVEPPITVTARVRPPWLDSVADEPGVATADDVAEALRRYAP